MSAGAREDAPFSARRPAWYALASLLLLLPCYWQSRIQAGDLSSHIYNAWLARLIQNGRTPGLAIVHQATNVLFDLILSSLLAWLGPDWAQRLAVSLCVLVFVWGAFAFVSVVAGRVTWLLLPCLAILGYGWVFHMGFFNFYLSLGLCFWGLAALWKPTRRRLAVAIGIFALAYAAHALPVLWAVSLAAYAWLARIVPDRFRNLLLGLAIVLLAVARFAVMSRFISRWSVVQIASATGGDQILVFDQKYGILLAALMLFFATCLAQLLITQGGHEVARSIPLHWCALTAAGIFIIPSTVLIPGFHHALVYIAERMSLAVAICFFALIGSEALRGPQRYAPVALGVFFFAFLFHDEWSLNRFEDRVDSAVAQLPPGQRVVSPIQDWDLRANGLAHMIDRACVGRCYSYANYEPSTAQFRIRAIQPNAYVIQDYGDSWSIQNGAYAFKPDELPVYELMVSSSGQVNTRLATAGMKSGSSLWSVLENRFADSK